MGFTEEQLTQIREIAESTGVCPTCLQGVTVNQYGISPTMVETLKRLAKITSDQLADNGERAIDVRKTDLDHNHRSSLSKLRQHGLIAKVLGDDKRQIAGHWLVTTKGYRFLEGGEVPTKVEVFNNTVLGHTEGTINLHEILKADKLADDPDLIDTRKIGIGEARALGTLREKVEKKLTIHRAKYDGGQMPGLAKGSIYDISHHPLATGKPVKVVVRAERDGEATMIRLDYQDVSAFMRDWKITL